MNFYDCKSLFEFFTHLGLWDWAAYLTTAMIACVLLLQVVAVGALIFIWLERKVSGRIQDRLGPTRVGGKYGWLQTLADGVKLLTKEDLIPAGADSFLFRIAPYISMCAAFAAYIALPFGDGWVAQNLDVAVFFILAVMGLEVFGVVLAGYSSGSKWSLFGGMREAAQVVSYEVPMGLCIVIPVMIAGTMNLNAIGNLQQGFAWNWFIFHSPFAFCTFWIYFTCGVASVNRAPFDLAEAESELVAGFHTEYSGLRWSFFFMAEYGSMFTVSALAVILFLGGWHGPLPVMQGVESLLGMAGMPYESNVTIPLIGSVPVGFLAGIFGNVLGVVNFLIKGTLGVVVMIWIRWTLPRLRIDQVMMTCLKYCFPLICFMFIGNVIWLYSFPNGFMGWFGSPLAEQRITAGESVTQPLSNTHHAKSKDDNDEKHGRVANETIPSTNDKDQQAARRSMTANQALAVLTPASSNDDAVPSQASHATRKGE
ncbi:MAG: NADH-quinone oxidoreductase subunit NuoH [Planctomycetales bacterium]